VSSFAVTMPDDQRPRRRLRMGRRGLLSGVATVGGLAFAGPASGKRGPPSGKRGPPGTTACDAVVPDEYPSIQAAVDAVAAGASICVRDGTYVEQVVLDKSLTVQAADGASPTIRAPASPDGFTIPESDPVWEPVVFAFGGQESGGSVTGTDVVDVTISGLTIDGDGRQPADRGVGILARNARGDVRGNDVENMGVGGKETFGVIVAGDSDVTIAGNEVRQYERTGIGANGDDGVHPAPSIDVRENVVEGGGEVGEAWGPNGIQIGFGASGTVRGNYVTDNRYGDSFGSATSAGIIVFGSSGVTVHRNEVANSDIALASASAENNRFVGNRVDDALIGAYVAGAENTKLVNNELRNDDPALGDAGVLNTGENNKLIGNTIDGFDTPIYDIGQASKVHANRP
jgi:parallel beta-helix repeat protein